MIVGEKNVNELKLSHNEYLICSTAERLNVTLCSIIKLSKYLLYDCDFNYVLTAKINQDPLEVFILII